MRTQFSVLGLVILLASGIQAQPPARPVMRETPSSDMPFVQTADGNWHTTIKTSDGREIDHVFVPGTKLTPSIRSALMPVLVSRSWSLLPITTSECPASLHSFLQPAAWVSASWSVRLHSAEFSGSHGCIPIPGDSGRTPAQLRTMAHGCARCRTIRLFIDHTSERARRRARRHTAGVRPLIGARIPSNLNSSALQHDARNDRSTECEESVNPR
jgi:hypothetical protein